MCRDQSTVECRRHQRLSASRPSGTQWEIDVARPTEPMPVTKWEFKYFHLHFSKIPGRLTDGRKIDLLWIRDGMKKKTPHATTLPRLFTTNWANLSGILSQYCHTYSNYPTFRKTSTMTLYKKKTDVCHLAILFPLPCLFKI